MEECHQSIEKIRKKEETVMLKQMEMNLAKAAKKCSSIKAEHPEYKFRIDTCVLRASVKVLVIQGKKILQVITFDKEGKESTRDTGRR